jgi:signal transduction histidine kinase
MTKNLLFKISSRLKDIIGQDLITDDFVAIFELVKNSFDANARRVQIYFQIDNKPTDRIFIFDDGKGMSEVDINERWLFVAFSAKRENTEDKKFQSYSGYKGVGRFSCDRLGAGLRLQTKTKIDSSVNVIEVNWADFEVDSQNEFQNIKVKYNTEPQFTAPNNIPTGKSGVILEISSLRAPLSWTREKLLLLKRSLMRLVDPHIANRSIELVCKREVEDDRKAKENCEPDPLIVNGEIRNDIFKVLEKKTSKIKASISSDGVLSVELVDRGTTIYKTEEKADRLFNKLQDSEFQADISFLNTSAKSTFARRMGIPCTQYGSVFLIRNGFQVFPIGEFENDYWGYDRRKTQGYNRFLGSRELLGFVKISGDEEKFKESSSRNQGLIKTEAAEQLSECVKYCIKKLEAYVVDVVWKDPLDSDREDLGRMKQDSNRVNIIELIKNLAKSKSIKVVEYNKDIVSIMREKSESFMPSIEKLKVIAHQFGDKKLIGQVVAAEKAAVRLSAERDRAEKLAEKERVSREKAEKLAETITKEKVVVESAYNEEVKRNLFLTNSGSRDKDLLEGFIHQIILYAANGKQILQDAMQNQRLRNGNDDERLGGILERLYEINENIISTARFSTTANFRLNSSMITEDVNAFVRGYLDTISSAYNSRITIHHSLDEKVFNLKFNPIEFGMIIENFVSNSKKARATKITFESAVNQRAIEISITDNGSGIDPTIKDQTRIFEKGYTRTNGSGLGLYICSQKIESMGGSLTIAETQPARGARFILKVIKK